MAEIIFWKPNDFRGTLYSRAFGVADYEFDLASQLVYFHLKANVQGKFAHTLVCFIYYLYNICKDVAAE